MTSGQGGTGRRLGTLERAVVDGYMAGRSLMIHPDVTGRNDVLAAGYFAAAQAGAAILALGGPVLDEVEARIDLFRAGGM